MAISPSPAQGGEEMVLLASSAQSCGKHLILDIWRARYPLGGPGAGRGLRPTFRDLRLRRVGEPGKRFEREHATLSLGRAAAELAERDGHVASENVCAGVGLDDDHLVPVRMPGRRQQADSR